MQLQLVKTKNSSFEIDELGLLVKEQQFIDYCAYQSIGLVLLELNSLGLTDRLYKQCLLEEIKSKKKMNIKPITSIKKIGVLS